MTKLSDILPKKKACSIHSLNDNDFTNSENCVECRHNRVRNANIDSCHTALEQAMKDGVICFVPSEQKIKSSMIFDFIRILLWHYYSGQSNEKTWEHNRERLDSVERVERRVEEDKDKIAKAIIQLLKNQKEIK